MKTEHGYQIIESYMIEPNRHLILVQREHAITPFVTWYMSDDGKCTAGTYFSNREAASKSFDRFRESYRNVS